MSDLIGYTSGAMSGNIVCQRGSAFHEWANEESRFAQQSPIWFDTINRTAGYKHLTLHTQTGASSQDEYSLEAIISL